MSLVGRISSLFAALRAEDFEALPPVERRRFADECRHLAKLADSDEPKSGDSGPKTAGVLGDLAKGHRGH